jgi:transposase
LEPLPAPDYLLADTAYDSDEFRTFLSQRGALPAIRPNPTRKNVPEFDTCRLKARNVVERALCRIKDWRRKNGVATNMNAGVHAAVPPNAGFGD